MRSACGETAAALQANCGPLKSGHTHICGYAGTPTETHVKWCRRNGGNICHATTNALFHAAPRQRNKASPVQCSSRTTNKRRDGRKKQEKMEAQIELYADRRGDKQIAVDGCTAMLVRELQHYVRAARQTDGRSVGRSVVGSVSLCVRQPALQTYVNMHACAYSWRFIE